MGLDGQSLVNHDILIIETKFYFWFSLDFDLREFRHVTHDNDPFHGSLTMNGETCLVNGPWKGSGDMCLVNEPWNGSGDMCLVNGS